MDKIMLDLVVRDDMNRLIKAQALSACRGGCPIDLTQVITQQVLWLRAKTGDFQQWVKLTEQSGCTFLEWYDWYTGNEIVHQETAPMLELVR